VRAESAVAMRSRLVANVSHELRTPINVIVGYADMLMDASVAGPEVADAATRIRHNAVTLEALIGELLDLSRLSSGKVELAIEEVHVPSLLADVAERTRFGLRGKPVSVHVDCALVRCRSDRLRLGQVLTNLASNAAKFTSSGRITIGSRESHEGHVFEVRDTGCGIPADRQNTIFDAFEQVVPGTNGAGGIGLGLAIVRQLVDLLGGTVEVASEVGVGSTFTVVLPAAEAPLRAPAPDAVPLDLPTTAA
jgi:signal transduction histidine kinase